MPTTPGETKMKQTPAELIIANRFEAHGVTQAAFLEGTLTPAMLQAYLTSIAPFEVYATPEEKSAWDKALIKSKEMMKSAGHKPLPEIVSVEVPVVKTTSEK